MKINHVFYSGLGGHGSVFFSLVKADKHKEYDYHCTLFGIEVPTKEYINKLISFKIPYNYIEKTKGSVLDAWMKMYQEIRKSKSDIVFLHGSYNILPVFINKIFKPKTKIIIRETQANHLKTKLEWLLLFISMFLADHIVFLSEEYKNEVKSKFKFFFFSKKTSVIPNGIDIDLFSPNINKTKVPGTIKIGMASRIVKIKDYSTLIKAVEKIDGIKLEIAGEGDQLDTLKKLVKELKIEDKVVFLGKLDEDELIDFYKSLDIYFHATFGETMSTSIMQAQACGLPIIASDVKGVNNVIKNGENGILVKVQNEQSYSEAIKKLYYDELLRKKLSEKSRQYAIEKLSMEKMFKSYQFLFI